MSSPSGKGSLKLTVQTLLYTSDPTTDGRRLCNAPIRYIALLSLDEES